jgi:Beta protein
MEVKVMVNKKPVAKATFPQVEPSFGHRHYVPVLKSKQGELWALERTTPNQRAHLTPLLEIHSAGVKTIAQHATKVMDNVFNSWGALPLFMDTCLHGVTGNAAVAAATTIFQTAQSKGLQFVPVTSIERSSTYQAIIAAHASRGVMIRLSPDDFADTAVLATRLAELLPRIGLTPSKVDILIDFGAVGSPAIQVQAIRALVAALPNVNLWRTLTVAGSAFPPSIAAQPPNQWNSLPRREWVAWRTAIVTPPFPVRLPAYADYGVRDTAPPAEFGSPYANIRYTAGGLYLVRRNDVLVKDGGSSGIYPICNSLRSRPEFSGPTFSAGDERMDTTGLQQAAPGNAGSWTQWAMSHHFAVVVAEILILLAA